MTNTRTLKPVAYFRATKGHGIVWGEDCCCEDAIFDGDDNYDEQETFSLPVYSADVVEALQKENENLAHRLNNAQDSAIKALEENAAQEKRIAELEAATELVAWGYAWECKSVGDWRIEKLGEGCIPPKDTIALYTAPEGDKP